MDHPSDDHIHAAEVLAEWREESTGVATASTSSLPANIQATPSFQEETLMAFEVPSHSQHEDYLPQLTEEQIEELMLLHTQLTSQENPIAMASMSSLPANIQATPSFQQETLMAFQVPSHSQHEDYLPQLTEEQKEELMRLHTQLTSQENPGLNEVTSFEFEEPQDKTAVYNEIFKEPQDNVYTKAIWRDPEDKDDVYSNPIWGESQAVELPDDSKSISEEKSDDQEVWTPQGERKQGRRIAKSKVNSTEKQQGKSKRGRPVKSTVKRKL